MIRQTWDDAPSMNDAPSDQQSAAETGLEQEIRKGRPFSMAEAIGRLGGAGTMKGASPILPRQRAEAQIAALIASHLHDHTGILRDVLLREVKNGRFLLGNFDQPATALADHVRHLLESEPLLKELVRATDMEWGRVFGERPHFEQDGQAPHPEDPYTVAAVRTLLTDFLERLNEAPPSRHP